MTNAVDSFINAIVEGLIKHEGFNEHIKGVVSNDGFTDDHLDNKIEQWMKYHFDLADYAQIDMTDYSYEIDGMIDAQVQYLAEDGDLKDWLDSSHEQFEEKVLNVLRTNTIRIEI
jgi:hypothetical protein